MPSGNFDEPIAPTPPQDVPALPFRSPADYYCAPLTEVRPIFPKWVPIGCGSASAVILVLLFAGGAMLTGPRLARFMDFVLGTSLGELRGMYAPTITATQKQRFDAEVKRMREGLRTDKVSAQNIQPFLRAMQAAIADKKVTSDELEKLTKTAHDATVKGKRSG
ncbi:MAG TPA: hypothetical protein VGK31_09895 [Thermoanaerobaculia bacterium]|jgi:hypothetical protein